ncbi:hypothetical protein V6N13_127505 [Hibiscus sabdariffa]|uniref:Autophagy-related protein 13 N-terminal domain-containing protein n=1 Tax=Hibiscus sabdariffa TaxID=183260 RepID=A0ABR2RC86_9ROSI
MILESRSPYVSSRNYSGEQTVSSSSSSARQRDKWFNLALRDCPSALENLNLCRQSNLEPVVVDVILEQKLFAPKRDLVRNFLTKDKNPFVLEFWSRRIRQ